MANPEASRLLVVEDETLWRNIAGRACASAGVDHIIVDSFSDGMDHVMTGMFGSVLSDGLEGQWVQLYQANQQWGDTRFALMSGDDEQITKAKADQVPAFHKTGITPATFQEIFALLLDKPAA